jgi:hypothetical protein
VELDQKGNEIMATKNVPSLGSFNNNLAAVVPALSTGLERTKGKSAKVSLTLRLSSEDWNKLHDFARREGVSLQRLTVVALAKIMTEKGAPPITGD